MLSKFVYYRPEHRANGGTMKLDFIRSWNAKMKETNG